MDMQIKPTVLVKQHLNYFLIPKFFLCFLGILKRNLFSSVKIHFFISNMYHKSFDLDISYYDKSCSVFNVLKKALSQRIITTVPFSTRTSGNDFINRNHVCKFWRIEYSVRMK
jgi:hypothetical protein